jgi:hypothetical protein
MQETGISKLLETSWAQEIQTKQNYKHWSKKLIMLFKLLIQNGNIMILHSPKNFGGTRSHPKNKVISRHRPLSNLCAAGFEHGLQGYSTHCLISLRPSRMRISQRCCQHPSTRSELPWRIQRFSHFHSRSSSLKHHYHVEHKEPFQAHSYHLTHSKEIWWRAQAWSNCNNPRCQSQCLVVRCEGRLSPQEEVLR